MAGVFAPSYDPLNLITDSFDWNDVREGDKHLKWSGTAFTMISEDVFWEDCHSEATGKTRPDQITLKDDDEE